MSQHHRGDAGRRRVTADLLGDESADIDLLDPLGKVGLELGDIGRDAPGRGYYCRAAARQTAKRLPPFLEGVDCQDVRHIEAAGEPGCKRGPAAT